MRFFKKSLKQDSWLSVAFAANGVAVASVTLAATARPVVRKAAFFGDGAEAAVLEKIGRELHAKQFRITTLLAGGEYQVRALDAPEVPDAELKTAVRWRMKDMLDFPIDEATIEVLRIPAEGAGQRVGGQVLAIAARNSVVGARQRLFAASHMALTAIDIPEMAQRNMSALAATPGRGLAMLSFGEDGGLLTVTFEGELYLSRRLDVTLAQLCDDDYERKHASFDKVTLEVQRSLDHFERQFNAINVNLLMLAPTGAAGLEEYLASNQYMPVATLDLAAVLDFDSVAGLGDAAAQQRLFMALGGALRCEAAA